MVNPFLSGKNYDTTTAVILEKANVLDIGRSVAYTDGDRIFINTPENLHKILPAYNDDMLFWLLWHEKIHIELKHHNRFFKYVEEFEKEMKTPAEAFSDDAIKRHAKRFNISKDEVNIIMDILVHDWMAKKFPDKVKTAKANFAQFRDQNSLHYTFKTFTLEEMLDEYSKHKSKEDKKSESKDKKSEGKEDKSEGKDKKSKSKDKKSKSKSKENDAPTEAEESDAPTEVEEKDAPIPEEHHDDTDWTQLDNISTKEFITKQEGDAYIAKINELKRTKIKLARITETLNGLITSTRTRSYKTPSYTFTGQHTIFKGLSQGRASLYLCFDASGSMSNEMDTFKEIISNAIPQAKKTPTTWFSGHAYYSSEGKEVMSRCHDKDGRSDDYYKGKYEDFMHISANGGYGDDGDRTIELCWKAEQEGYSPIGITDGGGSISWSEDMLKQLKRTVFIGHRKNWLETAKSINPAIKTIYTGKEE